MAGVSGTAVYIAVYTFDVTTGFATQMIRKARLTP
jgi:hypothetical protein